MLKEYLQVVQRLTIPYFIFFLKQWPQGGIPGQIISGMDQKRYSYHSEGQ